MLTAQPLTSRKLDYGPESPVPIFQHEGEFAALLDFYVERNPKRVLEVGTFHGGTLYHWLKNAARNATIISIDSYAVGVDNRELYGEWVPQGVTLRALCGDSQDVELALEAWRSGPFDWIFIDAGHYYHEVKADWETYRKMVADDGVIVLHDILPPSSAHPEIEVNRLWREIQAEGLVTQELIADPGTDWGGLGIVYVG